MKNGVPNWLFWTPRILLILFAMFLAVFALDVFGQGYGFWKTILALFMHLVPTFIILAVLVIAWKWERAGGILCILLSLLYLLMAGSQMSTETLLIIPGPLLLIGILFLLHSIIRHRISI